VTENNGLHRFAVFTAFCTFCLIIAGGLVTSTQSGLAVPDWPLSYGQVMPPMVGGIFYEHTHRLIAAFVGLLTILLAVWLWRKEERRWVRVLGIVAVGAVITQGLLGGLTVLFLLPTPISVSHATLAQTFFVLVSSIALFTSRWWKSQKQPMIDLHAGRPVARLMMLTIAVIYVQLILGALMRHTHSGLAVPDFPLSYGQLFPSLSPEALEEYNRTLIYSDIRLAADGPITAAQIVLHMLHRFWAIAASVLILWSAVRLRKLSRPVPGFSRLSYALIGLLAIQFTLGVLTVLTVKSVEITTAHVAIGALLLVVTVLSTLRVAKAAGWELSRGAVALSPEGATV
jgi:cytochrome c oxidase assembly protein subunit 15